MMRGNAVLQGTWYKPRFGPPLWVKSVLDKGEITDNQTCCKLPSSIPLLKLGKNFPPFLSYSIGGVQKNVKYTHLKEE